MTGGVSAAINLWQCGPCGPAILAPSPTATNTDEQLLPAATLLRPVREEHNARMVDHRGAFAPKLEKSSNPRKCRVVISRAVGVAIGTGYDT
jgi:hypothetical protein